MEWAEYKIETCKTVITIHHFATHCYPFSSGLYKKLNDQLLYSVPGVYLLNEIVDFLFSESRSL